MIPKDTLHADIHRQIEKIPVPSEQLCQMAYQETERLLKLGFIDLENDSIAQRINLLLRLWGVDNPTSRALLAEKELTIGF